MRAYEWDDEFSVGHAGMDRQHRRLFSIANDLYSEAAKADEPCEQELKKIIGDLLNYTRVHFAEEEVLMVEASYPGFESHKEKHDALIARIRVFEEQVRNGQVREVAQVLPGMIGEWLIRHIAVEDQQYARHIA